ncbi:hypothetical protein CORC01_03082 [Colletotrichum orchidophilum]|uniref:Uncharacterized protein n=1 Tax=Colletotrichum orchidophilum TaxID=1209926 RepID=A0A1G4BJG8_9PEZI|nr:uncharacterized protein CORC01_03082 [Colletotrichum orchidophilum]OHF01592.1 hypothetical protein CORC01_03082 [Colletotrichum orchidophilum]
MSLYQEKDSVESTPGPGESELTASRVSKWDVDASDKDARSVAGVLCTETIRAFRGIVRNIERRDDLPQSNRHCLKKTCDTLILWASGYGVNEGDLDEALATSWVLQRSMLELMVSVGSLLLLKQGIPGDVDPFALKTAISDASGVLSEGLQSHLRRETENDNDSDSSSDLSATEGDKLECIIQDIDLSVQCLLDLGPLINSQIKDRNIIEVPRSGAAVATFNPHQFFADMLSHRYPRAEKDMRDRLARANFDRFLRTNELRAKNAEGTPTEDNAAGSTEFNDSGIGTSIHTGAPYAATLMSYRNIYSGTLDPGFATTLPVLEDASPS